MPKRQTPQKRNVAIHINKIKCAPGGMGGCIYGLGFLGALIYYLTTATSVWMCLLGIVKAVLWPAFLVFQLMKFLGM
jgi:hypothetical protein